MTFVFMSLIMRKVCNYKSIHYTAHEMSIVKVTKLFLQRPVWLKNFSSDLDWWIVLFGKYLILKESKYPKCFIELDMKIRFLTFELSSKNQPSVWSIIWNFFDLTHPQRPPTEKVLKFNISFDDSVKRFFFQNNKIKSSNYWIRESGSLWSPQ